jgi:uncharacterized protein YbaP (TraB family)
MWLVSAAAAPVKNAEAIVAPEHHHGTLYRIQRQGNTAWLFGTIHVGTLAIDPLEGEAGAALANADKLVLEFDVGDTASVQAAVAKYAMYSPGDSLDKHLSEAALKRLHEALSHAGISFDTVAMMKPWFVANLLMLTELERHGYSGTRATEVSLAAFANAHAKPIASLESADFQLSLFDRMGDAEQEQYLRETLAEIDSGEMITKTRELFDAWKNADNATLNGFLKELSKDDTLSAKFTKTDILDKRNPTMADGIERLMKTNRSIFVGVGLLHLLGGQGLPELLRRRGYEVQRIY